MRAAGRVRGGIFVTVAALAMSGCSGSSAPAPYEGEVSDTLSSGIGWLEGWYDELPEELFIDPDATFEGYWLSEDTEGHALHAAAGEVNFHTDEEEFCAGTYTERNGTLDLTFADCTADYYVAEGALKHTGALEIAWADGSPEVFSPAPDDVPLPDSEPGFVEEHDTGAEVEGIWLGEDKTLFGVVSKSSSETGLATAHYLAEDDITECVGILTGGDGEYTAMLSCGDEDNPDLRIPSLTYDGETLTVEWQDGTSVDHEWISEWEDEWEDG